MKDQSKTKHTLIQELASLRQRIEELEKSEAERKRAEEALKESEGKYRSLIENIQDGIYILDSFGKFTFVNDVIVKRSGYPAEWFLDRSYFDIISEKDRELVQKYFNEVMDGKTQIFDLSYQVKSGNLLHLETHAAPIFEGAKVIGLLGVSRDITERKQFEEALRESEIRYRELFENMQSGVSVYETHNNGEDFIFKEYNASAEMLDNTPRGQAIGRSVVDVFPGVKDFDLFDVFQRVYRTGKPERHPVTFHKDERISGWRENHVYKLPSGEIVSVFEDITERKAAEEALQKRESLLQKIFDVLPVGLWFADKDGKLLRGNPAGVKIWGAEPKVAPAKYGVFKARRLPSGEEIAPEDWALVHTVKERVTVVDEMLEIDAFDGKKKVILNYTAPMLDDQGAIQGAIVVNLDITERKQAEEELKTSRSQLRALSMRLQQIREEDRIAIAREIHDEMGGGLTGLKMDLSWLSRKIDDTDRGEERIALMDRIHASNVLIDQMIQVVRRVSTHLRPSVLDDLGLIAALEWQLSEFTSRTEIPHEFTTTFEYVNMEEDTAIAVFRIFQEALTNVARHSRATKVAVVLRESERSLFGDESFVLEIRDNGRGITEEEILNPESLGLLGMKERVLSFGGELSILAESGGGTALVLQIPRKQGGTL